MVKLNWLWLKYVLQDFKFYLSNIFKSISWEIKLLKNYPILFLKIIWILKIKYKFNETKRNWEKMNKILNPQFFLNAHLPWWYNTD